MRWIDPSRCERLSLAGPASRMTIVFGSAAVLWPVVALGLLAWLARRGDPSAAASLLLGGP